MTAKEGDADPPPASLTPRESQVLVLLASGLTAREAGAQLAGIVAQSDPAIPPLPNLRLTALRAVKILGTARPGDVLRMEASVSGRMGNLIQCDAKVWVRETLMLSAEITLAGTGTLNT